MKFAVAALLGTTAAYQAMSPVEYEFMKYVAKYGKSYGTKEEYNFRLAQFVHSYNEIENHNNSQTTSTHGINQFADMTQNEKKRLTGYVMSQDNSAPKHLYGAAYPIDWRAKGAVTAVKDQGQCGSCWSFSTTGTIEGAQFIATGTLPSLSEQQFVDCSTFMNKGCNGGSMPIALMYAANHQVMTEADYPYTAKDGTCVYDESKTVTNVTGHEKVTAGDVDQFKTALNIGPISIAIEADKTYFQSYTSGILTDADECGTTLDHGVLAVGWGTEDGVDYAIVKNSWAATWGDKGYVKLGLEDNVCGLLNQPVYAVVG